MPHAVSLVARVGRCSTDRSAQMQMELFERRSASLPSSDLVSVGGGFKFCSGAEISRRITSVCAAFIGKSAFKSALGRNAEFVSCVVTLRFP